MPSNFFDYIISLFPNKHLGKIVVLFVFILFFDHFSIISRTDTYFMTENLKRIAEVREQYDGNVDVQKALEKRLQNELSHNNIFENFLLIFNNQKSIKNNRNILWNTLSSTGIFLAYIPFVVFFIIQEEKKGKTPFHVVIVSAFIFLFLIFLFIWMIQWITSMLPTLLGCEFFNYFINILFQLFLYFLLSSWINGHASKVRN